MTNQNICSYQRNEGQFPWTHRLVLLQGVVLEVCLILNFLFVVTLCIHQKDHDRNLLDHTSLRRGVPWCWNASDADWFHNSKSGCAKPWLVQGSWFFHLPDFHQSLMSEQKEIVHKQFLRTRRLSASKRTLGKMKEANISCSKQLCSWYSTSKRQDSAARHSVWCLLSYNAGLSVHSEPGGHVISRLQCVLKYL